MKPLKNHTLIYDNECPMCNLYSKGFIKSGMLDENGREAFTEVSCKNKNLIDFTRAKNEIALVDHNRNAVIYGLDSLLAIIGNSFPLLEKITKIQSLYWFFSKLYSFVSYNRKQIIPSKNTDYSCTPDFNLRYRLAYIVFVILFSSLIGYACKEKSGLSSGLDVIWLPVFYIVLILWQLLFLQSYSKENIWDYLGNMMTVSLIGSLLFFPVLIIDTHSFPGFMYFGIVAMIMLLEHVRRCTILNLSVFHTISWLVFIGIYVIICLYYV